MSLAPHIVLAKFAERVAFARPYFHRLRFGRLSAGGVFLPSEVMAAYGAPKKQKRVTSYKPVICIPELGGGWYPGDVQASFTSQGLPLPHITDYSVLGAGNNPGDAADAEVGLDIQCAAGAYSSVIDEPAEVAMIWAPNSDAGMPAATRMAAQVPNARVLPWSWGANETAFGASGRQAMDAAAQECRSKGVTVLAASGDNNASDGGQGRNVDCPACLPSVIGVGGTALMVGPDGQPIEKVWNDGQSGTGGGLSKFFGKPSWQRPGVAGQTMRGVPDVALVADPATGVVCWIRGQRQVIGGTSASSPLWAGIIAAGIALGLNPMNVLEWLYSLPLTCFNDVTAGNNGGYDAHAGQDLCSGIGTPNLRVLFANLGGAPPPPSNQPTATLVASPTALATSGAAILTWTSTNGTAASIDDASVGLSGSKVVSLTATATFKLTVTGEFGTVPATASVTVTVGAALPPPPAAGPTLAQVVATVNSATDWYASHFPQPHRNLIVGSERFDAAALKKLFASPGSHFVPNSGGEYVLTHTTQTTARSLIRQARAELSLPNIDYVKLVSLLYQLFQVLFGGTSPTSPPAPPAPFAAVASANLSGHVRALDGHLAALDGEVLQPNANWGTILKTIGAILQLLGPVLGGLGGVSVAP